MKDEKEGWRGKAERNDIQRPVGHFEVPLPVIICSSRKLFT
jgi:hypothetical protein